MEKDTKMRDEIYKELKVSFTSVEQQIKAQKEEKKLLKLRADLYNQCLDDHLLEKGSKLIRQHLDEVKSEMKLIDDHIEELIMEKDAYRIELEVFEDMFREKLMPVKKEKEEEETAE